ncbi:MAG: hypothetical protein RJA33_198 [Actinomycetota bacterium]|jgi:hypothetical protein
MGEKGGDLRVSVAAWRAPLALRVELLELH